MNHVKQAKRTTIYDLAELAGTSASAVSAVLNGNWKKRRISSQLAEKIMKRDHGLVTNLVVGVVGAIVGGFLASTLLGLDVGGFNIVTLLVAVVGAVILLAVLGAVKRR